MSLAIREFNNQVPIKIFNDQKPKNQSFLFFDPIPFLRVRDANLLNSVVSALDWPKTLSYLCRIHSIEAWSKELLLILHFFDLEVPKFYLWIFIMKEIKASYCLCYLIEISSMLLITPRGQKRRLNYQPTILFLTIWKSIQHIWIGLE